MSIKVVEMLEFQMSYLRYQKMMLLKCCTQYASNNGKLSSGHRTRKVQFSFQSQRKECQRMFKFPHNCTHFTCYQEIMLKILQVRLQEYINGELSDVQAGFRKGRGTRVQIANICWIIEKLREFQKNIFCFTDYAKAFD